MKVQVVLCDVKPCKLRAECEFEFNGEKIYVCGEYCFVKFWSREYASWKAGSFSIQTTFMKHLGMQEVSVRMNSVRDLGSDLKTVKHQEVKIKGLIQ